MMCIVLCLFSYRITIRNSKGSAWLNVIEGLHITVPLRIECYFAIWFCGVIKL